MRTTFGKLLLIGLAGLWVPSFINALGTNKAAAAPGSMRTSIVPAEVFQGRMQALGANQLVLQRYGGDVVEVNGENVSLGASGIALLPTDSLITSTGADNESGMAAATLYYIYVSNSSASPFPSDLRASEVPPTFRNGIKYLGLSDNAANWRFVGWVRTITP